MTVYGLGWRSKVGRVKAHFVLLDGRAACSNVHGGFSGEWVDLRTSDHLCNTCQRVQPAICRCGLCLTRVAICPGCGESRRLQSFLPGPGEVCAVCRMGKRCRHLLRSPNGGQKR